MGAEFQHSFISVIDFIRTVISVSLFKIIEPLLADFVTVKSCFGSG